MTEAKVGDTVKVHYTGKFEDGTVFDSSQTREPIQFTIGQKQLIPGFEQAVIGMNPGESKSAQIPSNEAYGPHRPEMVVVVQREQIPAEIQPAVGQQLQLRRADGQPVAAWVTDVAEDKVTLDANHPLAGKDLTFELELLEIA